MPKAHEGHIWDLDWHPLGHVLATASNDLTVKFWTRNRPGDPFREDAEGYGPTGGRELGDRLGK